MNNRYDYLLKVLEGSLRRLGTDYIDLHQIRWPDPNTPIEETARAPDDMVNRGKVRYVGVSNYSASQMEEFLRVRPLTSLQLRYNMLGRMAAIDLFPFCLQHGIGVLAYAPVAHGLLMGKFTEKLNIAPDDHR